MFKHSFTQLDKRKLFFPREVTIFTDTGEWDNKRISRGCGKTKNCNPPASCLHIHGEWQATGFQLLNKPFEIRDTSSKCWFNSYPKGWHSEALCGGLGKPLEVAEPRGVELVPSHDCVGMVGRQNCNLSIGTDKEFLGASSSGYAAPIKDCPSGHLSQAKDFVWA